MEVSNRCLSSMGGSPDHPRTDVHGLLFNGQLKGSRHTPYSADGSFISQKLEIDSADYLARQLRLPTFLFHADVEAKKLSWSAVQLDQKVLEVLECKERRRP